MIRIEANSNPVRWLSIGWSSWLALTKVEKVAFYYFSSPNISVISREERNSSLVRFSSRGKFHWISREIPYFSSVRLSPYFATRTVLLRVSGNRVIIRLKAVSCIGRELQTSYQNGFLFCEIGNPRARRINSRKVLWSDFHRVLTRWDAKLK